VDATGFKLVFPTPVERKHYRVSVLFS